MRRLQGIITSDKMLKTVSVSVPQVRKLAKLRRFIRRHKKFLAESTGDARIGDTVLIEETRPLSRRKRWKVIEIIKKAPKVEE